MKALLAHASLCVAHSAIFDWSATVRATINQIPKYLGLFAVAGIANDPRINVDSFASRGKVFPSGDSRGVVSSCGVTFEGKRKRSCSELSNCRGGCWCVCTREKRGAFRWSVTFVSRARFNSRFKGTRSLFQPPRSTCSPWARGRQGNVKGQTVP